MMCSLRLAVKGRQVQQGGAGGGRRGAGRRTAVATRNDMDTHTHTQVMGVCWLSPAHLGHCPSLHTPPRHSPPTATSAAGASTPAAASASAACSKLAPYSWEASAIASLASAASAAYRIFSTMRMAGISCGSGQWRAAWRCEEEPAQNGAGVLPAEKQAGRQG